MLKNKDNLLAAGIALLIILPNLIWQFVNDFPVVTHMLELRRNQLVNVQASAFLKDQLIMNFTSLAVWLSGLWFLWKKQEGNYRVVLFLYIGVLILFILTNGKHYYTLGMYPVLMAAGAVFWEDILKKVWMRVALPVIMVAALLPLAPLAVPLYKPAKMATYSAWAGKNPWPANGHPLGRWPATFTSAGFLPICWAGRKLERLQLKPIKCSPLILLL